MFWPLKSKSLHVLSLAEEVAGWTSAGPRGCWFHTTEPGYAAWVAWVANPDTTKLWGWGRIFLGGDENQDGQQGEGGQHDGAGLTPELETTPDQQPVTLPRNRY